MNLILPDTNAWIKLLNPGDSPVKTRFREADPQALRLCAVVKAELYYGVCRSPRRVQNLALLERLFATYPSLPFEDVAAKVYGDLRAKLEAIGKPIGPHDLMIAAIALAASAQLVTHNIREFGRVAGLQYADWELPSVR